MNNTAATRTRFFIIVKRDNGRTWYRADSASSSDARFMDEVLAGTPSIPGLRFAVGSDQYKSGPRSVIRMAPSDILKQIEEFGK